MSLDDEQILMTLQRKGDFVDLISTYSENGRIPWIFKSKIIKACITSGLSFELTYANALLSAENRRQFLSNARCLMGVTKNGEGIVISSGAENILQIRAPYDVANMSALFSVDSMIGRKFVSSKSFVEFS